MQRRLAAVLMTDVVGYSRLMEADEAGTLAALKDWQTSILEPTVADHGGRIVKIIGDGVLVEFGSAVNAVAGAIALQDRMAAANTQVPEDRRIVLRIGINLGDVIGEGDDIYGEGVNIAARLEPLAAPGGIALSAKVYEEVRGKLACGFDDMGEQTVKNIARPIRVYRLRRGDGADGDASTDAGAGKPALSLPDRPSIAVLPFQNLCGDPEQEYFADGLVEDIITELSRVRWLFVIARNSSFTYKGRAVDVKDVGQQLGVRYVLEGSVRKAGSRVRVTGQLIDAATRAHLWADHFDGELADIFDLQDQVTARVVGTIAPRLEQAEIERAKRRPPHSLDAYDSYLRGMAAFHAYTKAANAEALAFFNQAIARDPSFASAYGMAARCYLQRVGFGWIEDRARETAETERLARRAAEVGRDDAVALGAAGAALVVVAGDLDEGVALIDRALALNRNLAWAWTFSAVANAMLGNGEAAIAHADRAARLSPQDPQMFGMEIARAWGHFIAGRYDEALTRAAKALRDQPNFAMAACVAAASAALAGRPDDAARAMTRVRALNPRLSLANLKGLVAMRHQEDFDRWAEGLKRAGLPD